METKRWWRKTERTVMLAVLVGMMPGTWTLTEARAERSSGIDSAVATSVVPSDPDRIRNDLSAAGMDVTSPAVRQLIKNLFELDETYFV